MANWSMWLALATLEFRLKILVYLYFLAPAFVMTGIIFLAVGVSGAFQLDPRSFLGLGIGCALLSIGLWAIRCGRRLLSPSTRLSAGATFLFAGAVASWAISHDKGLLVGMIALAISVGWTGFTIIQAWHDAKGDERSK